MQPNISAVKVASLWFPLVKKFYQAYYSSGKPNKADPIWALKDGATIIAAVRLKQFDNQYQLLTGLVTHPELRNQGYASHLMQAITQELNQTTYCFNHEKLIPFYERHGFDLIQDNQLPSELAGRLRRYQIKQPELVAMSYHARSPLKTT